MPICNALKIDGSNCPNPIVKGKEFCCGHLKQKYPRRKKEKQKKNYRKDSFATVFSSQRDKSSFATDFRKQGVCC